MNGKEELKQQSEPEAGDGQARDCVYFFFSSRRRHTRLTCDGSSDVCSSDLDARLAWHEQTLLGRHGEQPGSATTRLRRSEEHTSELQSHVNLVCRLLLEK